MEAGSSTMVTAAKLPVLNPGEFELWKIRIEQYFLMTDYALWEVIVNGDSPPPKRTINGVEQTYPPTTEEEKLARKNELKARGTLLMALPNEHKLKFNTYKCAKTVMEAIEKRFGGNKESKKTQKTLLKQQYKNFNGSGSEGLDQTYDRLQKLIRFNKSKVECYNYHKKGHFARECRAPRENRNKEHVRRNVTVETTKTKALVAQDRLGYDWSDQAKEGPTNFALIAYTSSGSSSSSSLDSESQLYVGAYKAGLESVEAILDVYKKNEVVFEEDIKILKLDIKLRDIALTELRKKFEKTKKERDDLKLTLEKFGNSSKNLRKLYKTSEGYPAVPPPYTGNFMPPKSDLVLADEEEYVFNWISDSEDENETQFKSKQRKRSFAKIEFVKSNEHVKIPRESVKKKLRSNFEFKNKACYECGSFNHLIKDCDFYEKKMVEKTVWNNSRRVNHQNSQRMTYPHPKGNFVPKAILMKYGIKTLNTAGQNFSKAAVSVKTARPINTVYLRPTVNSARTSSNVFNRAHSHVRRPFNNSTTNKNSTLKEKVNNVKENVTTVGPIAAGNPQLEFQEKGVINSGCSRHMTGYKSYLSDYEEIDGGFVAFGGDPKGGRITGKGKISTGKLDFEDVYFVKELKFILFNVSQMCDKKNSVLFTNTECVVLSLDFKLLDENHVLLRVPRKYNMYSVDLKNIVLLGGRKPALSFMRPFGCPVTILNTLDHLGKFDGKADEGFFVGHSTNRKAYRVFNSRTRIVEENLHIKFSEETPNIAGNGPNWLFDIDALTILVTDIAQKDKNKAKTDKTEHENGKSTRNQSGSNLLEFSRNTYYYTIIDIILTYMSGDESIFGAAVGEQAANIDQSPPLEMSLKEMEDLMQHYLDEMKSLSNDLQIKDYRNEKIDIHFRRKCKDMIAELKSKFNGMGIEINKKKELQYLEQVAKLSTHTTEPSQHFNYTRCDYEESTIPLNEIDSQTPPSIEITPVLPNLEPEDSLIMGNEELSTIPEKELDKFINSSVEDLVSIPSESEDTSESDSVCDLTSCDDFSPINVSEEQSVTFSNPLIDSNDDLPLDSYDSNLDESTFLVTPLSDSDEDECKT
ncbi:ribonuclease H-like domain-containing protein [Tanacetum coccineum]